MADLGSVETALVGAISAGLYPNGTSAASIVSAPCRVYRGWPNAAALDADLLQGIVNVSVFTRAGMTRQTTRYERIWQVVSITPATLTATVWGQTITISGMPGVRQLVGCRTDSGTWVYPAKPTDGPAEAAAGLGALIPGAAVNGTAITVPGAHLVARTGGFGQEALEIRRQVQGFLITIWAPSPDLRDAVSSAVDLALAQIDFLPLSDGSAGRMLYANTAVDDVPSQAALWRRDLVFSIEYPTLLTDNPAQMLFGGEDIRAGTFVDPSVPLVSFTVGGQRSVELGDLPPS
jgi:hypothetical protein